MPTSRFDFTLDVTLRYQRTPCARYHARPLSLLQQEVLYRCDGRVTVADLADATRCLHPEIRAALAFLSQHGLIKTLPPDPTLFAPLAADKPSGSAAAPISPVSAGRRGGRAGLKRVLRGWNDRLWYRLTWDVRGR